MFRPNRIGDHQVCDLSAPDFVINPSAAEFVASLGDIQTYHVQTDTAALGDPISCVNAGTKELTTSLVIAANKSYSFGRFISGAALNNRAMMIGYSIKAYCFGTGVPSKFAMSAYAGIANAASVTVDDTAQTNLMDTACLLESRAMGSNLEFYYDLDIQGTIVNTLFNGGASGAFDTNPLGIWVALQSLGTTTLKGIRISISIYRYSEDVDTFDPTR